MILSDGDIGLAPVRKTHREVPFDFVPVMCGNAQLTFHRNDIVNIHHKVDEWHIPVLQQRFDEKTKSTWWGEVDPWITDDLYLHPRFKEYFDIRSGMATDGLYPTVTIRQIMWALKMKPIKRERWETVFDRRDI